MASDADLYKRMAEIVDAVEHVDGVELRDADIAEVPAPDGSDELLSAIFGPGKIETEPVIITVARPVEEPHAPYPEEPDADDFEDIEVDDDG